MNATKTDKKIKLSDAQYQSLRKLYTAHVQGKSPEYKWATDPTKMALYKLGLIDGEVQEKSWRSPARLAYNSAKINAAGVALGKELFGMEWWEELIGAWISQRRAIERQNEQIANELAIINKFDLTTKFEFEFSGKSGDYKATIEYGTTTVKVERPYIGYNTDKKPYGVFVKNLTMNSTSYSPEGIEGLSTLLLEAADICRKFQSE